MALPSFLKHVAVLERAGLISSTKVGRTRTVTLLLPMLGTARSWIGEQERFWNAGLDRLASRLENT